MMNEIKKEILSLLVLFCAIVIAFGLMIAGMISPLAHWIFDLEYTTNDRLSDIQKILSGFVIYIITAIKSYEEHISEQKRY